MEDSLTSVQTIMKIGHHLDEAHHFIKLLRQKIKSPDEEESLAASSAIQPIEDCLKKMILSIYSD